MNDCHDDSFPPIIPLQRNNKNQARLRLSNSDERDLCNSCSLTAASPLGSEVRPVSMSLTEEGVKPTRLPISAKVIPLPRRSVMRDAQVFMPPNIRQAVDLSQRQSVTEFRKNTDMPRPADMPADLDTPGKRVGWWRKHRKFTLGKVAGRSRCSPTALSDFENGRSKEFQKLHLVCAVLKLNPFYVDSGRGEPEAEFPQEPPPEGTEWPIYGVEMERVTSLDANEMELVGYRINDILNEIEAKRGQRRRAR